MESSHDYTCSSDCSSSPEPNDVLYVLSQPHVHNETKSEFTWPFQAVFGGKGWVKTTPILLEYPEDEVFIELRGLMEPEGRYFSLGINITSLRKLDNVLEMEFSILYGPRPYETSTKRFIINYSPTQKFWLNVRFMNAKMGFYLFDMADLGNVTFSMKTTFNVDSDYICPGKIVKKSCSCILARKRFKYCKSTRQLKKTPGKRRPAQSRMQHAPEGRIKLPPITTIINAPGFEQLWSANVPFMDQAFGSPYNPKPPSAPRHVAFPPQWNPPRFVTIPSHPPSTNKYPPRSMQDSRKPSLRVRQQPNNVPILPMLPSREIMSFHTTTCRLPLGSTIHYIPPNCCFTSYASQTHRGNVALRMDNTFSNPTFQSTTARQKLVILCDQTFFCVDARTLESASVVVKAFLDFCSPPVGSKRESFFALEGTQSKTLEELLKYLRADGCWNSTFFSTNAVELARQLHIKVNFES